MASTRDETSDLHQHRPITGEQYAFPNDAYRRLQNYAMNTGFAIVICSDSEKKHGKPRKLEE